MRRIFPVNDRIKEMLDSGDEETNVRNAIEYMNQRIDDMYTPNDYHYYYDEETDEDIPYLPNTYIDIDEHYGREF
ncbi:hypothetical protein [Melioribacter sp. OK-6-Me]|uniref:hypothetical protein n=1 Tax=unclassified Melioribacter TaxID=2627329 RepID=UPI003EDA3288